MLLVVLLAQMVPSSPDSTSITTFGDIAGLHKAWESSNLACRKLPHDSPEGEGACSLREILGMQLSRLGWCVRYMGLEIKWEMCPPDGKIVERRVTLAALPDARSV